MARPGITKQEVANAVTALRAEGRPTTTRVVRLELGRGSYATIGRFLEELNAKGGALAPELPEVPEAVQRRLAESVYAMWEAMASIAKTQTSALQRQFDQRLKNMAEQLGREQSSTKRSASELSRALTQASAFKSKSEALELELAGVQERLAIAQALLQRSDREREQLLARLAPPKSGQSSAPGGPILSPRRSRRGCLSAHADE